MRRMQGRRHPPEDVDRAWRRALPLRVRLRRRLEADIFIESVRDGEADVDYPTFVGGRAALPAGGRRPRPRLHGVSRGSARSARRKAQRGGELVREAVQPGRHRTSEACGQGLPRWPLAAGAPSRGIEAQRGPRFDLTHIRVPVWDRTPRRQLGLVSTVSLRTDCCRTTSTGRRRARGRTRRCSERHHTPPRCGASMSPSAVVRGNPRAN